MTPYIRRATVACMLTAAGIACGGESTAPASLAARTAAAEARWNAITHTAYSFIAMRVCECTADARGPVLVTVHDPAGGASRAVTVARVDNGATVDPALWFDVDALFGLIHAELADRPQFLDAVYDSAIGFPSHVVYGNLAVDAGATIEVSAFHVN